MHGNYYYYYLSEAPVLQPDEKQEIKTETESQVADNATALNELVETGSESLTETVHQ